jgi:glycosyltransferase involved in cell wall biosynthesis
MLGNWFNRGLREYDFLSYQRPDYIIANSQEVQSRIKKFYRREAEVIYPPVEIPNSKLQFPNKFQIPNSKGKYYLAGGRLARAKRIDLAIEVCNRLKLPLKIYGRGFADYDSELKGMAGPTVEFMGEVSDEELNKLYLGAKALIYPSEQEDFGIIPVEAQSYGVPVIGLNQGGVKETVISRKTGVLFDEATVESLIKAIKQFNNLTIKPENCIKNAQKFNKERFKKEIKEFVYARTSRS